MDKLPEEVIEKIIAKYKDKKGFRELPVRNFLGTVHHCGNVANARANLKMDSIMYKWKPSIVSAIAEGINHY